MVCCLSEVASDHTRFLKGLWTPSHSSALSPVFRKKEDKPPGQRWEVLSRPEESSPLVSGLKGPVRAKEHSALEAS